MVIDEQFYILTSVAGFLLIFDVVLLVLVLILKKKFDLLFKNRKVKNLEELFLNQLKKIEVQDLDFDDLKKRVGMLERISEKTFQKMGVVRFNPFTNMGGNQSFVIALLDKKNNGLVISSLFIKDGNRVYTKEVKAGKSEHSLSDEEREALQKAMVSKIK